MVLCTNAGEFDEDSYTAYTGGGKLPTTVCDTEIYPGDAEGNHNNKIYIRTNNLKFRTVEIWERIDAI